MRAEDPAQRGRAPTRRAGDLPAAANLRGEVALKEERIAEAAAFFQQGQDYLRAAELFESIGHAGRGRRRLRGGRELRRRGRRLHPRRPQGARGRELRARGRVRDRGQALRGGGHRQHARIPLYEKAGFTFKSGEAAARAGDRDQAIALLQRVAADDENYRRGHRAPGAPVHRGGQAAPGRRAPAEGARRRARLRRDPRPLLLAGASAWRRRGQTRRRSRSSGRSRPRTCTSRTWTPGRAAGGGRDGAAAAAAAAAGLASGASARAAAEPPARTAPVAAPQPAPSMPAAAPAAAGRGPRFAAKEEIGRGPLGAVFRGEDRSTGAASRCACCVPTCWARTAQARLAADLKAAAARLASEPRQGARPRRAARAALRGHRVRGRPQLRRGAPRRPQDDRPAGAQPGPRAGAVPVARPRQGPRARLHPALEHHGGERRGEGRRPRPRPPGPRAAAPPGYRAPENELDVAGDLYALAAVLYHLLTGVHPALAAAGRGAAAAEHARHRACPRRSTSCCSAACTRVRSCATRPRTRSWPSSRTWSSWRSDRRLSARRYDRERASSPRSSPPRRFRTPAPGGTPPAAPCCRLHLRQLHAPDAHRRAVARPWKLARGRRLAIRRAGRAALRRVGAGGRGRRTAAGPAAARRLRGRPPAAELPPGVRRPPDGAAGGRRVRVHHASVVGPVRSAAHPLRGRPPLLPRAGGRPARRRRTGLRRARRSPSRDWATRRSGCATRSPARSRRASR